MSKIKGKPDKVSPIKAQAAVAKIDSFDDQDVNPNTSHFLSVESEVKERLEELGFACRNQDDFLRLTTMYQNRLSDEIDVTCNLCDTVISCNMDIDFELCACQSVGVFKSKGALCIGKRNTNQDFTVSYHGTGRAHRFVNGDYAANHSFEYMVTFLKELVGDKPIKRMELFGDYYNGEASVPSFLMLFVELEEGASYELLDFGREVLKALGIYVMFVSDITLDTSPRIKESYERGRAIIKG